MVTPGNRRRQDAHEEPRRSRWGRCHNEAMILVTPLQEQQSMRNETRLGEILYEQLSDTVGEIDLTEYEIGERLWLKCVLAKQDGYNEYIWRVRKASTDPLNLSEMSKPDDGVVAIAEGTVANCTQFGTILKDIRIDEMKANRESLDNIDDELFNGR